MIDTVRIIRESFVATVEHHEQLASTQNRARELGDLPPAKLPLLVLADRQSAGRGRLGRSWWTGEQNLALSLLLHPPRDATGAPVHALASIGAAVAVIKSLARRIPEPSLGLHWPNDVFVAGRKLAGVLVERLPQGRLILGIGVNTNSRLRDAPAELQARIVTLREMTGKKQDHTEILIDLLQEVEQMLADLSAAPSQIAAQADALCLQRGQPLLLEQGQVRCQGICAGIAPDGALLLDTAEGRRAFHSGTVGARPSP